MIRDIWEVATGPRVSRVEATRTYPRLQGRGLLWGWAVGPPHFHGRGSEAVPALLLCDGSCRVRRAGVTCWALAPGCNPCFHEQAPSYGAIEDPEQSLV